MTKEVIKKSTTTAKKRLKDVTFDHEGAHLALCSKEQGAANNQENAVILKSKTYSPELIAKAQRVQVTMELPDFLEKFFGLWYSDSQVLARLMGYVPEEEDDEEDYKDWIQERADSFTLLKSLHEAKSLPEALSALTEEEYSKILDDQEVIAKSIKEFESSQGVDNSTKTKVEKVEPVGSKTIKKGKKMTQEVETIEKSKYVEIEKQLQTQKEELQKAKEQLEALNKEKAEALIKSRVDILQGVLKDEGSVEIVMKAAGAADAENFEALVSVFKKQADLLEKSDLFKEKGVTVETEENPESTLAKLLKAKYPAKQ